MVKFEFEAENTNEGLYCCWCKEDTHSTYNGFCPDCNYFVVVLGIKKEIQWVTFKKLVHRFVVKKRKH